MDPCIRCGRLTQALQICTLCQKGVDAKWRTLAPEQRRTLLDFVDGGPLIPLKDPGQADA